MAVPRLLKDKRFIIGALVAYFLVAAWVGGPWFALFTGGLVTLVAGFVWWISRDKRLQVLGTTSLVVGLAMTGGGIALGQNPTVLPDEQLPYRPIVPRPTVPVFQQLDPLVPKARPEATASETPTPTPRAQAATRPTTETRPSQAPNPVAPPVSRPTSSAPQDPAPTSEPPAGNPGPTTDPAPTTDPVPPSEPEPTTGPAPTTDPVPPSDPEPTTGPAPTQDPVEPRPPRVTVPPPYQPPGTGAA